ncbi:MAG: protease pro-enzyme activation domain-containing protein [Oryzomonas sp.]|uniref:protease pro-enzyme activation domain-containing protein n=1 Tax=Oryzomonas sp. TaxID=2855186 RepID=UPI00284A9660|nr:protease pro-enzyme activation domain-containing protein [Oryzomonas sp.]MDR3580833.1 protease pro-enzyme activation domain-containing protein [Oryzomonas sp.]
MHKIMSRFVAVFYALAVTLAASMAYARTIDNNNRIALPGNVHPSAQTKYDAGAASDTLPLTNMVLSLTVPQNIQTQLEEFLASQQNPSSSNYHKWLAPAEFGAQFGNSAEDITTTTNWLKSFGFTINAVSGSRTWINFSGTAAMVKAAFGTPIHNYTINGRTYTANSQNPTIPAGFSDLIAGVVTLHNFPRGAMNTGAKTLAADVPSKPEYTNGSSHYIAPGDFATIYDLNPLYSAGITGNGQTIAIVGRTHPSGTNWANFRSTMGLPANPPQVIINGPDPGDLGASEDLEADLDVEWSGAVAKNATIKFVVSKSTNSTDGVDLSAQYIVENNLAPLMSVSFGACEAQMGTAENTFYNNLWQQAAAQGISVFVSSGDSGAAGCSSSGSTTGSGLGVNGLASTPYNVAVGGTEFNEGSGSYWNSTNGTGDTSAKSYIPETAWNESGSGNEGLWSSGGGVSIIYAKPSWQVASGVPSDGMRDVPDVALTSSGHDAYMIVSQGQLEAVSGTSAASPSFAGIMALVVQKYGRQGNPNLSLYPLAKAQYGGSGVAAFHDITSGNNSVPGVVGYTAGTGYDRVTGLGSVDANVMVTKWTSSTGSTTPAPAPTFKLTDSASTISLVAGNNGTLTVGTTTSGSFTGSITLSISGLPSGVSAAFSPATITTPSSGNSTLTFASSPSTTPGTYLLTITAAGGGMTQTASVSLTMTAPPVTGTTLVTDNFAGGGWDTLETSAIDSAIWGLVAKGSTPTATPYTGSAMAEFNSAAAKTGNQAVLARVTGIALPTTAKMVTLKFWMYHDNGDQAATDTLQPVISMTKNLSTWTKVGTAISRYAATNGWAQANADLTAYKGQTVYIGFLGTSAHGENMYLNEITVTDQ